MSRLKLVPVPSAALDKTEATWRPFVESIAKRTRQHAHHLVEQIYRNEIQVHIAWDDEAKEAKALGGTRVLICGDEKVGQFIWMTGSRRAEWVHLLHELEEYHKTVLGCSRFEAIARPGWKRELQKQGYRMTHVLLEKDLK